MREIDFLPAWYPLVRRSRMLFRLQLWATVAVIVVGSALLVGTNRSVMAAEQQRSDVEAVLQQTRSEVSQLDEMLQLQQRLLAKRRIVVELGMPVEMTRVVGEIAACMPGEMALLQIGFETDQRELSLVEEARLRGGNPDRNAPRFVSRTLRVDVQGVAPTEAQVGRFYAALTERNVFEQVRLVASAERVTPEHVMREFQVTFAVPLDYQLR